MSKPAVSLRPPTPPTPAPAPDDWVTNGPASLKHLDPAAAAVRPRGLHSRRDGRVSRKRSIYLTPATDQRLTAFCGEGRTASSVIDAAINRYLDEEQATARKGRARA